MKPTVTPEKMHAPWFLRPAVHLFLIVALGLVAYANTFTVPFLLDDLGSIAENPVLRSLSEFLGPAGYQYNPRRFVGYLTFALNYRLGGLDVTGYHAVNLALHLANALLIYGLLRLLMRTPFATTSVGDPEVHQRRRMLLPLLTALIFVAHPVETQAVTYIVQRLTSLMSFWYLATLVLYLKMREGSEGGGGVGATVPWYLGALLCCVLAMKTKENAFTLPVALLLVEVYFCTGALKRRLMLLLPFIATMAIIPLSLISQAPAKGGTLAAVGAASRSSVETISRLDYLFTQFRVIVTYLRLLVAPVGLRLDYDYPVYHSLAQVPVICSLVLLCALGGGALYLGYRSVQGPASEAGHDDRLLLRLISFGILFFFLTLSVESSIIPIDDVIFEHRIYLPSAGFFIALLAVAFLLEGRLVRQGGGGKVVLPLFALVALLLAGGTLMRNAVYREPLTIWADTAMKSPKSARALNNYATALNDAGRPDEAFPLLERALAINPLYAEAYNNLGRAFLSKRERPDAAAAAFLEAIRIQPDFITAYGNLGAAYNLVGRFADTVRVLAPVARDSQGHVDVHLNLGAAYGNLRRFAEAEEQLRMAQSLDPVKAEQLREYLAGLPRR